MSTYTENLQSTVLASLQALELEQNNMEASLDAAELTLFYAEGARITAAENLKLANQDYRYKQAVLNQAVINSNIAINLLGSANEENTTVAQSVTNAAVSASNVQIAANAILKLSADMGSIFSILDAADYGTDIYTQAQEAYQLMSETAYLAEYCSQLSMEASSLTAEVSASTVASMAGTTNTAMTNYLQVATNEFNASSTTVANDTATLNSASNSEKAAEGVLEYTNAEYMSVSRAYVLNNKELNLDLKVTLNTSDPKQYTVSFDPYRSPFPDSETDAGYPVMNYNIMLVKSSKQNVFNMATAESLLVSEGLFLSVPPPKTGGVSEKIDINKIRDSDGDPMAMGGQYVIFVLIVLNEKYKKAINDFDDYLTAPSAPFTLTYTLNAATGVKVSPDGNSSGTPSKTPENKTQALSFSATNSSLVEYRAMFLPVETSITSGMLTSSDIREIEKKVEAIEDTAVSLDPMIKQMEGNILDLEGTQDMLGREISELEAQMKNQTGAVRKKTNEKLKDKKAKSAETATRLKQMRNQYAKLKKERDTRVQALSKSSSGQVGFIFTLGIAEQINISNYTVVNPVPVATGGGKDDGSTTSTTTPTTYSVELAADMTDVFGNRLMEGVQYVPVVLSASNVEEENLSQYTNALSDFEQTPAFRYIAIK